MLSVGLTWSMGFGAKKEARPRTRAGLREVAWKDYQKSTCTAIFAYRAGVTVVGVSHDPPGMNPRL
jgi:hypothetical protein